MKKAAWVRDALLSQLPLSVAVMDRTLTVVDANEAFRQTYGEWQGKKCYWLREHRQTRCPHCAAVKTFQDGRARTRQQEIAGPEGSSRHYLVQVTPLKNSRGKISYVVETSWDITDRVRLEKKYRLLFDHVPCYVTVIDRDFRVLEANHLFRETFSRKGARHCYELYKGLDKACPKCPALEVFRTRRTSTSVQVGVNREGKKTHYMVTAAPLISDGRTVESVIEMAQDISLVVELQERLKQVEKEKLDAERQAAVGQTVAGLAHGVKNILTGLEGGMYVLNSGLQRADSELVASGWKMLQNNIAKISTAVKEYLTFASGGRIRVETARPAQIAREALESFADEARQQGVLLKADVNDSVAEAPLDPAGVRTCLGHLLSNALDACGQSEKKRKTIRLSCREEAGSIVYEVEDNGIGMDRDTRRKVFRSFFSTRASGQGKGLGLLITRRIVQEHGGRVSCESTPGKGSRFRIEFPRSRLPQPDAGSPGQPQAQERNP